MRLTTILTSLLLALLVIPSAQAQPVDQLEKLLEGLRKIDPAAWAARVSALEARVKASKDEAARLRSKAAALEAEAKKSDDDAKKLLAEIGRQKDLMKLIGPKTTPVTATAKKPVAKKPVAKKPVAKKPVAKKPVAKKPVAKKPVAKKPVAKKPVAKKPVAKKPVAKKPVAKKSVAKKSVAKKPAAKKPAAKKPAMKAKPVRPAPLNYEDDVLPVLEQHCVGCHSPDDSSGGLDVATYEALMNGGSSGAVVKKNASEESRLWRLVAHKEMPTMPPDQGMIEQKQVDLIAKWIDQGAFANAKEAKATDGAEDAGLEDSPSDAVAHQPKTSELGPPMPPRDRLVPPTLGERRPIPKALAGSPTAALLAAPGRGQILLYESATLELLGALAFPYDEVEALEFSEDGERLVAGGGTPGKRGGAVLYDVRSGVELRRYGREFDSVLAVAMSPGKTRIALGGPSKKVRVFDVESGEKVFEIKDHNDWIVSIDISPDGNFIASADRSGGLVITEADTGLNVHKLRGHTGAIWSVRFRPDAKLLATAGADGTIRMWEMDDGRSTRRSSAGQGEVLTLAWNRQNTLASAGTQGRLKTWKADGAALTSLPALPDWTYALAFPAEGRRLFAGQWSGALHIIDVKSRKEVTPKADT